MVDRDRCAVTGELQQADVLRAERPWRQRADVDDADQPSRGEQGHAEQRLDALLAQGRVEDVRAFDVVEHDGTTLGRDTAGEATPDRDVHTALDRILDPNGSTGDEIDLV